MIEWNKAQHATAYFGLALLGTLGWDLRLSLWMVYLAVVLLGASLEVLQGTLGREAA